MPEIKSAIKKLLARVGLLPPAESVWHRYLRSAERRRVARLYRQLISAGDLCFDIGANVGEMSKVMLDLGANVVALEPQSENIAVLRKRFAGNSNFTLVPKAAGAAVGSGALMVCDISACSSMSSEFVEAVTQSGRLPTNVFHWNEVREVPITTIDELINIYGTPVFLKIDVEGLEAQVIKGCSLKLKVLSLEFTPERLQPALDCVGMLEKLGDVEFNYTVENEKDLRLSDWVSADQLIQLLRNTHFRVVTGTGGDLYARFK